jgi:hypothetical protein
MYEHSKTSATHICTTKHKSTLSIKLMYIQIMVSINCVQALSVLGSIQHSSQVLTVTVTRHSCLQITLLNKQISFSLLYLTQHSIVQTAVSFQFPSHSSLNKDPLPFPLFHSPLQQQQRCIVANCS